MSLPPLSVAIDRGHYATVLRMSKVLDVASQCCNNVFLSRQISKILDQEPNPASVEGVSAVAAAALAELPKAVLIQLVDCRSVVVMDT